MNTLRINGIKNYLKHTLHRLIYFEWQSYNVKSFFESNAIIALTINEKPTPKNEPHIRNEGVSSNREFKPVQISKTAKWITNRVAGTVDLWKFKGFTHGYLPGFRIKEFIEPEKADMIAKAIVGFVEEYKTAPGVGRAGVTAVEYPHDFGGYAVLGAILRDRNASIPYRLELADAIIMFLTRNTGYQFKPLHKDGVECFWGLFRELNTGAGWHLDNVTKDMDVFSNRNAIFQCSSVLHIKTPKSGGETIIANRRSQEGDQEFLNEDGWTYDGKLLEGIWTSEVPAVAGDLVFLSTLNYHMVKPCLVTDAERISFSMFFVIFEDELNTIYYYN
ncbi:MAG: hypothetical protein K1X54_11315 [Flavobacteriales bacterium]|nr:hypothetical protein [Flavobacteriales bacterium]